MKLRKVIVFTLVLSLLIGATLSMSSASPAKTDGSIDFKAGNVTIVPPEGPCCHCYGNPPCDGCEDGCSDSDCSTCCTGTNCDGPCVCLCHDPDEDAYNDFFLDNKVENNLYFGNHSVREFGRFDSANLAGNPHNSNGLDTTDDGKYTGVEVRNMSGSEFKMGVSISAFYLNGSQTETLQGADLYLVTGVSQAPVNYPLSSGFQHLGSSTTAISKNADGNTHVLTVPNVNMVKASWSGILDTVQGTAAAGKAQAELTWTVSNAP